MSITESQRAYLRSKMSLIAELPSLYQAVGGWDAVVAQCKSGSAREVEAAAAMNKMLSAAHAMQAQARAYLVETGADAETLESLAAAEECCRKAGRMMERMRRCKPGSKRWQEMDRQHAELTNRGLEARDKYGLWVMTQVSLQP